MPSAPDAEQVDSDQPRDNTPQEPDKGDTENNSDAERPATGAGDDQPFPPRGTLTLRALRWGGLIAAVVLGVAAFLLRQRLNAVGDLVPDEVEGLAGFMILGGIVLWPFLNFRGKPHPIWVTIMTTTMATLGIAASISLTTAWWTTYQSTGFSVLFLLALAAAILAAALFLSVGPLLHFVRTTTTARIGDPDDPSRWASLQWKTGEKTDKGRPQYERIRVPRRTRACLTAIVIAPALTLGSALAGTWALVNPVHHVIAKTPADPSLAPPTSLAPTAAWSKEISSSKLTTVAGAGGPIVLTDDGVMALNPKDGSLLWSYNRKQAKYDYNTPPSTTSPLITSPNGKYVALRILLPDFAESANKTLVFDTLTGKIVFENMSTTGPLQLTDSAILDNQSAFSLVDGKKLWTISDHDSTNYSGTAGHASFILHIYGDEQREVDSPHSYKSVTTLQVTPQEDLSAAVDVEDALANPPDNLDIHNDLVKPGAFVKGWAARYTGEVDQSGNPMAEAISLDALAKVDGANTKTFPLGATSGINTAASVSSESITTYVPIRMDRDPQDSPREPRMEKVFDPYTLTVTSVSQYPGFAGSPAEIINIPADDGSLSAAIMVRSGEDSTRTMIPITPGSTHLPPSLLASTSRYDSTKRPRATRTPGAVIATFDATSEVDCAVEGYDQNEQCVHTFRIFGITGDQK
ncbi:MFS transporter [Actinomyces sp. ZJ308]|uniref:MFS transporter n=1 Tax=Actinomyces sp. ZJ308 TaxID=2708342 RepID=UPI0014219624|nr:MFS transporter [Actinomyces sp. ZJ308]